MPNPSSGLFGFHVVRGDQLKDHKNGRKAKKVVPDMTRRVLDSVGEHLRLPHKCYLQARPVVVRDDGLELGDTCRDLESLSLAEALFHSAKFLRNGHWQIHLYELMLDNWALVILAEPYVDLNGETNWSISAAYPEIEMLLREHAAKQTRDGEATYKPRRDEFRLPKPSSPSNENSAWDSASSYFGWDEG